MNVDYLGYWDVVEELGFTKAEEIDVVWYLGNGETRGEQAGV